MGKKKNKKVSYIRKPLAKHSFPAMILSAAGLIFTGAGIWLAVKSQGQAGLNAAAFGFCAMVVSIAGLLYCFRSSVEKEKNYILAKISAVICGLLLLFWICMVIAGLMR